MYAASVHCRALVIRTTIDLSATTRAFHPCWECAARRSVSERKSKMKTLEKVSDFAGKYMAIIALAVAIIALIIPGPVHSALPTSWVNTLLGIVMFGMGMTLKLSDFKVVFTKPKAVIVGICSQFIVMPLLAFLLVTIFQLPTELAVGVILVGCCPGGTSSNVMTYLSKGDVALSVGMTACTTIMAPVVTPALVLLLAGQSIDVSYVSMLMSIVQVVSFLSCLASSSTPSPRRFPRCSARFFRLSRSLLFRSSSWPLFPRMPLSS